jgi:ABC-type transport system involved in cytochrome c biogenesis permease subunit
LILFVVRTYQGWRNKSSYSSLDEKLGFWMFMLTHTQLILGIVLYFISPAVVFSGDSMKDATARYWLVEHGSMMLISIALITLGRITTKKITDSVAKYKKLFVYNGIALLLILMSIQMSGRGIFTLTY